MASPPLAPGLSLVVCCHNSSAVIEPTIEALANQEVPAGLPMELVLVDNNCRDDTVEKVRRCFAGAPGELRILRESQPGLIHARRTGVREARYDLLFWVDDDNILAPGWLRRACEVFAEQPRVGAVGGVNKARIDGPVPEWFPRFEAVYACGTQAEQSGAVTRTRKMLFGAGLAFRTQIMRDILGGDQPLYLVGRTGKKLLRGDDSEICMRAVLMGWELWYDEGLHLEHCLLPHRVTWDYVCKARQGGAAAFMILQMYIQLIDGHAPSTRAKALRGLLRQWKKYLRQRLFDRRPRGPGSARDIEWSVLMGRTRGLWSLRNRLDSIRQSLLDAHGERWIRKSEPKPP